MSILPFSVSTDAAAWIIEILKKGAADPGEETGGASWVPSLGVSYGYAMWEKDYAKLLERYDETFFDIGWYLAEEMDPGGYLQIEIGGFKVFVHHTTLDELEGKELILETVEVGYPIPASQKRQLLRAKSKGGDANKPGGDCPSIP